MREEKAMREEGNVNYNGVLSPCGNQEGFDDSFDKKFKKSSAVRGRTWALSFIVLSLFLFSARFISDDPGESTSYKFDDFEFEFYDAWECSCEEVCQFEKRNENYYVFSNATSFHGDGKFFVRYFGEYDSLFIYQRFEYSYGILYSETEGVILFDSTRMKTVDQNKMVSYGNWIFRPINKYGVYNLKLDQGIEGHTVTGPLPSVNRKQAEDSLWHWRFQGASDDDGAKKFIKENKGLGLFVRGIEIRLKVYHKGKIKRFTFYFPYRHGEC